MKWQHNTLKSCKLSLGSGRSVIEIDEHGYAVKVDEYAEHALKQWGEVIGFQLVATIQEKPAPDEAVSTGEAETSQASKRAPKKRRTTKK